MCDAPAYNVQAFFKDIFPSLISWDGKRIYHFIFVRILRPPVMSRLNYTS